MKSIYKNDIENLVITYLCNLTLITSFYKPTKWGSIISIYSISLIIQTVLYRNEDRIETYHESSND